MPKLNQRGFIAQLFIMLILGIGLGVGIYLVKTGNLKIFSRATISGPVIPETSFTLQGPNVCKGGWTCLFTGRPQQQEEFEVNVFVRSDIEEANLFVARMKFPEDLVEVKEIKTGGNLGSFVTKWVEEFYDNKTGEIALSGGAPDPVFKTEIGKKSGLMATIVFRAKALGKGTVAFTDESEIFSNRNNINILTVTRPYDISVEVTPSSPKPSPSCLPRPSCLDITPACKLSEPANGWCPTPVPSSPKPTPTPSPKPGNKGDGNKDGKINLTDMSILHTDWRPSDSYKKTIRTGIDMNDDGYINTFDFSALRRLLQQFGVIKVRPSPSVN